VQFSSGAEPVELTIDTIDSSHYTLAGREAGHIISGPSRRTKSDQEAIGYA